MGLEFQNAQAHGTDVQALFASDAQSHRVLCLELLNHGVRYRACKYLVERLLLVVGAIQAYISTSLRLLHWNGYSAAAEPRLLNSVKLDRTFYGIHFRGKNSALAQLSPERILSMFLLAMPYFKESAFLVTTFGLYSRLIASAASNVSLAL